MNEIFLVVWLVLVSPCDMLTQRNEAGCLIDPNSMIIQSQTVSTESELNKLYQEHKDDGVRVWKISPELKCENPCITTNLDYRPYEESCCSFVKNKIAELEFVPEPCGSWKEK